MKGNGKRNRLALVIPVVIYIVSVVCLFWFHPFVASAKETDEAAKKVPGGNGNKVHIYSSVTNSYFNTKNVIDRSLIAKDNVEIVGYLRNMGVRVDLCIAFVCDDEGLVYAQDAEGYLKDYVGVEMIYKKNVLDSTTALGSKRIIEFATMYDDNKNNTHECTYSGMKVFKDADSLSNYADTGSLDGMIKDEVDKNWYLKDVRFVRESGDDAVPEQYQDNVAVYFTWLTDNLQDGDLLEVKTYNYLKKPFGDKISGFHDYITWQDNVSAYVGKFRFLQYDPAKAWVDSLADKPLFINSYDTDTYYLRPYRNGKVGIWCKVVMGRDSAGRPYAKDVSYGDLDDEGEWDEDEDATEKEGGHHGIGGDGSIIDPDIENPFDGSSITGIFKIFFDFMKSLPSLLGDLPELVKTIVGFLPDWLIGLIGIAVIVVIILRIIGR